MNLLEVSGWVLVALSIIGVVLNIYEKKVCFIIWTITNFCWMLIDFYEGIYSQGVLFFVYFVLAIWGYYKWTNKKLINPNH